MSGKIRRTELVWVALFLLLVCSAGANASSLTIKKVNNVPVVDGKLEEAFWGLATRVDLKEYKGKKLKNKTIAYLAYDKKNIYLAFKCYERRMNELQTTYDHYEERDNPIWKDDCIEVFLDPFSSKKNYYHIIVNSAGVIYDSKITDIKNTDVLWESKIRTATFLGKDFWTVELAIPFFDFGYFPKGGETWRINLCREEKPDKELSCLSPTHGNFSNPEKFADLVFERAEEPLSFVLASLSDNGENKMRLIFDNQTDSSCNLKLIVHCLQKGESFFSDRKGVSIPALSKKEIVIPYNTKLGEQSIDLTILDLTQNKPLYQNRFSLLKEDLKKRGSRRVWNLKDPLYKELFSKEPAGLVKEGAMVWHHGRDYKQMRLFASQYGLRYVYDEMYKQWSENNLHPMLGSGKIGGSYWKVLLHDRKHKVKEIIHARGGRGANAPKIGKYPFLPDPIVTKHYLAKVKKDIENYSDVIWAVFAGDELNEIEERVGIELFKTMKDSYPYIVEVDKEVKERYGHGKYGIPLSVGDKNPYRWIAYRKWMNEKMADILGKLYEMVKETNPEMHVISYDPMGAFHLPYDYSLWKGKCDIITHQLLPRGNSNRAHFGFITKLLRDISGIEEVWPCEHVEHYAASFTPEEVLELLSQVFRNGGTGFHYYLNDTIGRRAKKKYMHYEYYGAPDRWQIEMALVKEAGRMNKLKFPSSDHAILYSCDSYATQPPRCSTAEIEYAYTFLGPNAGSWFTFIDDNQVYRKEKNLSAYKAIYIPFAKYQRPSVIRELEDYVKNGGILISGDPEVFSLDTAGNKIDDYREKLFGIKIKGGISQREIEYKGKILPVYSSSYDIIPSAGTVVLATFPDGKPAIVTRSYGKGKTMYFASNPFTVRGIANQEWKDFFMELQTSLGMKTGYDIWRFQFPESLIKKPSPPKGKCLTNNYIFWSANEPVNLCNLDTNGTYTYSLLPDRMKDQGGVKEINLSSGDLTDRKKAPTAGNVELGKSRLSDWIVSYARPEPFNITFDFKKAYNIEKIRLFYSGQLPVLGLSGSKDGKNWKELNVTSDKETFTKDILDKTFKGDFGSFQYLKIDFGERDKDKGLTLSEIEIWTK